MEFAARLLERFADAGDLLYDFKAAQKILVDFSRIANEAENRLVMAL